METFPLSPDQLEIIPSPEQREIMEEFQEKRVGILNRVMNARAAKMVEFISLTAPGLDIATMTASAIHGETLTGEELDGRSRLNHAAIAGFLAIFYILLATGNHKEALVAKAASKTISAMEFGPDIIKSGVQMAKEKAPGFVDFMQKTGDFINGDAGFVSLNLHG